MMPRRNLTLTLLTLAGALLVALACALSPVLLVNKNYYGKLTPAKVDQVLKKY